MKKIALLAGLVGLSLSSFAAFDNKSEESPWLIRARAIWVKPDPSSSTITTIGGNVTDISSTVVPELDFTYFFTKHFAAELILATNRHSVTATGTTLGTVNLGKVSLLPPTLTAQYHFTPRNNFAPYVGAGINYTIFYDIDTGPTATAISYKDTFNPALQAGLDYQLNEKWSLNVDVKKIFLETDVSVTAGGPLTTSVKINPWIVGVGVGYRA